MAQAVLCVDDDPKMLAAYRRFLAGYAVETVAEAEAALAALDGPTPFAVLVSDLHMPGMNGIQLLAEARRVRPDTARVLLTGGADLHYAIEAVNDGHVFRFLTKPCLPATLQAAVAAAAEQYRLVTAERVLLDQTLRGCVRVLGEVLALVSPPAFGRANRAQQLVRSLGLFLPPAAAWDVELAATLSQLGCVTVPERVLAAAERGEALAPEQQRMVDNHPAVAEGLLRSISRLGPVAEAVAYQDKQYDGANLPALPKFGGDIPFAARLLKVVLDFDRLLCRQWGRRQAVELMKQRAGWYDPAVLRAVEELVAQEEPFPRREVKPAQLAEGMTLAEDLFDDKGTLILRKGHVFTEAMILRVQNHAAAGRVPGMLVVSVPDDDAKR
jgi:response regulator RpfG family c-di-GMP phosphodiesterase